jgi:predicted ferric reductase
MKMMLVEAHAVDFCTACVSMNPGTSVMKKGLINGGTRTLVIKRGSTVLSSGSPYTAGETLTVSLGGSGNIAGFSLSVTGGGVLSDTPSSCTDNNVSVSRVCTTSSSSTYSWTMPTDSCTIVTAKIAFASGFGQAYVTNTFSLGVPCSPTAMPIAAPDTPTKAPIPPTALPTHIPTLAPTQIPTAPTLAPTAIGSIYAVVATLNIQGITVNDMVENPSIAGTITTLISSKLNVYGYYVTIVSTIPNRRRILTDSQSLSSFMVEYITDTVTKVADNIGYRSLASTGIILSIQINGYKSTNTAISASTVLNDYIIDTTSAGFNTQLATSNNAITPGTTTTSIDGTVTYGDVTLSTAENSYQYSCPINDIDTLYWNVNGKKVNAMYVHQGVGTSNTDWLSIGLAEEGQTNMAGNNVFLYRPNIPSSDYYYYMSDTSAEGFQVLTNSPNSGLDGTGNGITNVRSIANAVVMTFNLEADIPSNNAQDIPLNIGLHKSNNIIYASGGVWPTPHLMNDAHRGFATVSWTNGVCANTGAGQTPSPLLVFLLPLSVMIFNSKLTPLRWMMNMFPFMSSLVRLSPTVLSKFTGSSIAWIAGLDESQAPTYTMPSLIAVICYGGFFLLWWIYYAQNMPISSQMWTRTLGDMAVMNMWLALLPASKTSIMLYLTGVPYERAIKYHRIISMTGIFFACAHFTVAKFRIFENGQTTLLDFTSKPLSIYGVTIGYGFLAFICYISMFLLAIEPIRQMKYEIFWIVHRLWLVGVFFTILHIAPRAAHPGSEFVVLGFIPGILLQLVDSIYKYILCPNLTAIAKPITALLAHTKATSNNPLYDHRTSSADSADTTKSAMHNETSNLSIDAVKLTVSLEGRTNASSMNYVSYMKKLSFLFGNCQASVDDAINKGGDHEYDSFHGGLGQWYLLNIPDVSHTMWHPFSVSEVIEGIDSSATGGVVTFHIKSMSYGSWTNNLARLVASRSAMNGSTELSCHLRGPYGSLSLNLCEYRHIVLVSGGIGVTPMLPILDRLKYWLSQGKDIKEKKLPCLEKITVIWSARQENQSLLIEFADRMSMMDDRKNKTTNSFCDVELKTYFHITGGKKNSQTMDIQTAAGNTHQVAFGRPDTVAIISQAEGGVSKKPFFSSSGISKIKAINTSESGVADAPNSSNRRSSNACVLVCGPQRMATDVSVTCSEYGIDYHLETFGW